MNPQISLQTLIVLAIVLGAAAYLVTRWRRTLAVARAPKDGGCAAGCGCSPDH
ncbi:MAG TPA: hypothetical protein VFQ39_04145 [Longimicrobium sp.]|nr:hypothetical protein [Longimicrobium sp.]